MANGRIEFKWLESYQGTLWFAILFSITECYLKKIFRSANKPGVRLMATVGSKEGGGNAKITYQQPSRSSIAM